MGWQETYADRIGSYSKQYVPQNVCDAMGRSHRLGVFFRLDTDPALHIWLGVSDVPAGFDSVDEDGTVYLGGGRIFEVPPLEVLLNGQSEEVMFGLSGIDPKEAVSIVSALPNVRGKKVHIGLTTLDDHYQPMSKIIPIWYGTATHTIDSVPPVQGMQNRSMTLMLATMSGNTTRSRPSLSVWSEPHQTRLWRLFFPTPELQLANPRDRFCDGVARLARGVQPVWPDN